MSLQTCKRLAFFSIVVLLANHSIGPAQAQGKARPHLPTVQNKQTPPQNNPAMRPGGIAPLTGPAGFLGGTANPFLPLNANAYPFAPFSANAYPFTPLSANAFPFTALNAPTPFMPFPDYFTGGFGYPGMPYGAPSYPYSMSSMYPLYGGGNYSAPMMLSYNTSLPYDNGMTQGAYGSGSAPGNIYEPSTNASKRKSNADSTNAPMLLTAFGLTDESGGVRWPLAFRLLPPQKEYLRRQVEAVFQLGLAQAMSGQSNSAMAEEARQAVASLRQWLTAHEDGLAEATLREARQFLRKLDGALRAM